MSEHLNEHLNEQLKGGFTLPGEAGYEDLTLALAQRWGADVIRDSDGTALSDSLLSAGYGVYSTLCIIREHNAWIQAHPWAQQQCILCTAPRVQTESPLRIALMDGFFAEQFQINDAPEALAYWQVYDRTSNSLCPREAWHYDAATGEVIIASVPWHTYTVSFFALRIWEEISMYNPVTNGWDKEHLRQLDPVYPEVQACLKAWLHDWCLAHPQTTVVRFTSFFYNFVWIWGSQERNRHLFSDWASYDFTVSPLALQAFETQYGYALTAEDFVNQGRLRATHSVPDAKKRDWMAFTHARVCAFAKELVDIVHGYGKQAYVFYDDSWVGLEPYGPHYPEIGLDGMIKCVFSGFEARLCAGVPARVHEIRLHPYLFPVGLGGAPTFSPGGDPATDAWLYWRNVRRALLRQPVDRIGLGGYLHLTQGFPTFVTAIEDIAQEFRQINAFHQQGAPECMKPRVAVLHAWGALRPWTLSGHFHETDAHDLIHVLESLSGLPFEVRFLDFVQVKQGALRETDVLLCAGLKGTAWSGGECWDDAVVEAVTAWVHQGGALIGINEPSALEGYATQLRMAHVLGVDVDCGRQSCHGKWRYEAQCLPALCAGKTELPAKPTAYLTDGTAEVWQEQDGSPALTCHVFGQGKGLYLSGYRHSAHGARLLLQLILLAAGAQQADFLPSDPEVECAWYANAHRMVLINNSAEPRQGTVQALGQTLPFALEGYRMQVVEL